MRTMEPANPPSSDSRRRVSGGRSKVMAADRQAKRKQGQKSSTSIKALNAIFEGLQKAKSSLARSLSRKRRAVSEASSKTLCNDLNKQTLFKEKEKRKHKVWQVNKGEAVSLSAAKICPVVSATSGGDTSVASDSERWAKSGTWPSNFSKKGAVASGDEFCRLGRRPSLYDRWKESNSAAISAAQKRVRQLKRTNTTFNSSLLNASRLKEVYERNHEDDRQDAIQGKKFTYMWILEQEALVPMRLANLQQGRAAHELDGVEEWSFGDCINSVLIWEKDVQFEEDDCT